MDTVRRLVWLALVTIAAFFAIFVVLGNFVATRAQGSGVVAIHDVISPGAHHLNGILVLPLSCDELNVSVDPMSSTTYQVQFTTWQDPSIACPSTPTPRPFETVAFAPSTGILFTA